MSLGKNKTLFFLLYKGGLFTKGNNDKTTYENVLQTLICNSS